MSDEKKPPGINFGPPPEGEKDKNSLFPPNFEERHEYAPPENKPSSSHPWGVGQENLVESQKRDAEFQQIMLVERSKNNKALSDGLVFLAWCAGGGVVAGASLYLIFGR